MAKPATADSTTVTRINPSANRERTRVARDSAPALVDLDVASEAEIEKLPRIGPVLAQRIVEDRTAHGPFGSLAGFERVRGVGPSLSALLGTRVTFSGTARPSNALVGQRLTPRQASPRPPRRSRRK
jgi:DNA uptake protein ComE-like DNA-binding protein